MAVIKIHKTQDYTIMSNRHLRERGMSLKAKGLLSLMLSLPEKWNYSVDGLVAICKENETAIKSALKEIEVFGYLVVRKLMPNETKTGRIEYIYDIYEMPKQDMEKQGIENLPLEFLPLENQGQLNIENKDTNSIYNTNKTKKQKKEKEKEIPEIVLSIWEHWQSKNIFPQETLTEEKHKAIEKKLKSYSVEVIKETIDRYTEVIFDSDYFFNTKWYLDAFLSQKNAFPHFLEDGQKWVNYQSEKQTQEYDEEARLAELQKKFGTNMRVI